MKREYMRPRKIHLNVLNSSPPSDLTLIICADMRSICSKSHLEGVNLPL